MAVLYCCLDLDHDRASMCLMVGPSDSEKADNDAPIHENRLIDRFSFVAVSRAAIVIQKILRTEWRGLDYGILNPPPSPPPPYGSLDYGIPNCNFYHFFD